MTKRVSKFMTTLEGDKTRAALKRIAKKPPAAPSAAVEAKIPMTDATPLKVVVKGKDVWVSTLKHTPTKAQEQMIKEGMPRELAQSDKQRGLIRAHLPPPKAMPAFAAPMREEGEDTKRFRAQVEAQEQAKKTERSEAFKASRPQRPTRPSREGMTTVADIAKQLKTIPRLARAALRAAKEPKPSQGWAFPADQVARIMKIINDHLTPGGTKCKSKSSTTKERKPRSTKAAKRSSPSSPVLTASSKPKKSRRSSKKATPSTRSKARTAKRKGK